MIAYRKYDSALKKTFSGLFHKAISFSGTWRSPWSTTASSELKAKTKEFTDAVGCPSEGEAMLNCLKSKSSSQIMQAKTNTIVRYYCREIINSLVPQLILENLPDS